MLTYYLWDSLSSFSDMYDYFYSVFMSIFTIPLDIILLPLELIAFIIYKIKEG